MSDKVLAAIKKLSDKPIRYIINTSFDPDHTGGNEAIAKAGSTTQGGPPTVIAHENVLNRMSAPAGKQAPTPAAAWPTDTYFPEEKDIFFNDEAVMLYHDTAAHTDGDTIVFFRRSDVVVAGDIFVTTSYPVIDQQNGGSVQGVINGLNRILDITVPKHEQEGGTYVIPGHGHVCDESEVLEYRDMVTIIEGPDRGHGQAGADRRPGEGREADARLRSSLRRGYRPVDDRDVHRGGVQGRHSTFQTCRRAEARPSAKAPEKGKK